jgi:hypothetical protein
MYPLASGFGFRDVAIGTTAVSKVETPLPIFTMEAISAEGADHFLAKVEMDAEKVLGSYGPREHDALMTVKLPNGGRINQVFEQMGVPYAPRLLPGTEAFQIATKKRKTDVSKKPSAKKMKIFQGKAAPAKAAPPNKMSVVKVTRPKAKPGPRGTSEIELVLAKLIRLSKKFRFLDMPSISQSRRDEAHHAVQTGSKRASRVIFFDNLDDSSPDAREASPPERATEVPPPPLVVLTYGFACDSAHPQPLEGTNKDLVVSLRHVCCTGSFAYVALLCQC